MWPRSRRPGRAARGQRPSRETGASLLCTRARPPHALHACKPRPARPPRAGGARRAAPRRTAWAGRGPASLVSRTGAARREGPAEASAGAGTFTSKTAPGAVFASRQELAEHNRSDWHRCSLLAPPARPARLHGRPRPAPPPCAPALVHAPSRLPAGSAAPAQRSIDVMHLTAARGAPDSTSSGWLLGWPL